MAVFRYFILLTLFCEALTIPSQPKSPKVCALHVGCMRGKYMPGFQTDRFEAYLGIPYALPPVGELRFSNPKSFPRWSGILNATEPRMDCIQKNYLVPNPAVYGTEDCLYLNLYRPIVRSKVLPVMVYIYGGGWFSGSSSPSIHGPEYFMDTKEVILITFAYRLGAFGFLSTNDQNMPGNFALKDQTLVLRWIQKNIAAFGGNPKMVTIFGQSAGGISAHMHMLSKQSEGLFRNVISLSGTANVPFAITNEPLTQARRIAELCNISNAFELSTAKLTRALRNVDATTLVNAGDGLKYWDVDHLTNFRPVIEPANNRDAFFVTHPTDILKNGLYKPVPWLAGVVPNEGAVRVLAILENDVLRNNFNAKFNKLFEMMMEFPESFTDEQLKQKVQTIVDYYFQGERSINFGTAQAFLDVITDRGFHRPYFNAIKDYVNTVDTQKYPIFLYRFNYSGLNTYAGIYTGGRQSFDYGVVHCDDLIYLFRSPLLFPDFDKNSTDAAVVQAFVSNFVHFAKYSKPQNMELIKPCNNLTFNAEPETICDYQEFTNINEDAFIIKTENKFNVERVHLWDAILEETSSPKYIKNTVTTTESQSVAV
ncbi:venom carboxylesterase-6-like [Teleopsis dalmanni]|uniref:venom carboxylesterase-6-like n=1 Tax=Teleopsis dalmanni TaxID=139649 RepID=UPI0018CF6C8E|nr:venom carboxylesterase-6-like [Teleopsis dalmanni]